MSDKMHGLVLTSQNGGAGRTTVTAHCAMAAEAAGDGPAVLIDADPQISLLVRWNVRVAGTPALTPTTIVAPPARLAALADAAHRVAMVDTPPAITEAIGAVVRSADLVVIPARPSSHDLRTVGSTTKSAQEADKPFVFAVTQVAPNTRLSVQAVAARFKHGGVTQAAVHDGIDYAGSMIDGRAVAETDPPGRGTAEVASLWDFRKVQMARSTKDRAMSCKPDATLSADLVAITGSAAPAPDMPAARRRPPVRSPSPRPSGEGRRVWHR